MAGGKDKEKKGLEGGSAGLWDHAGKAARQRSRTHVQRCEKESAGFAVCQEGRFSPPGSFAQKQNEQSGRETDNPIPREGRSKTVLITANGGGKRHMGPLGRGERQRGHFTSFLASVSQFRR